MGRAGRRKRLKIRPYKEEPFIDIKPSGPYNPDEEIKRSVVRQREKIDKLKNNSAFLSSKEKYKILKARPYNSARLINRVEPRRRPDKKITPKEVNLGPLINTYYLTTIQKGKVIDAYQALGINIPDDIQDILDKTISTKSSSR